MNTGNRPGGGRMRRGPMGGHGPMGGMRGAGEKAKDFKGSIKNLLT